MISVSIYLSIFAPEFIYRLETEYKLGKAYQYFSCDFVREIYYHLASERSCQCILKCKIVPSQQVSIKPYDVWAIIEKDQIDKPGGKIYSAYCTSAGNNGRSTFNDHQNPLSDRLKLPSTDQNDR